MKTVLDWLESRTGYRTPLNKMLYEPIPGGARWRYVWGTTLMFTFFLQLFTGVCLWMSYSPSASTAWESVFHIQNSMALGWLVRGIHHFAAQTMMVLLVIHLMQVVIDGAYKAPREVNFWLGLVLMQIVAVLGVTGYLLPWDQKGFSATQVVTGIIGSTPVVGSAMQQLVQGGTDHGHLNLTRFFALHAGILPLALLGVLTLHLKVFRRHKLHAVKIEGRADAAYWPDQCLRDSVACLVVLLTIIGTTFFWGGAELSAPADPSESYAAARPEWYYLFLFKLLSIPWVAMVGAETGLGESFGAVFLPGAVMTVLLLMPFIARWRFGHGFNVAFLWVIVGMVGILTGWAVHSDWIADTPEGRGFRAAVRQAHVDAARVTELANSPAGIPPTGAVSLLRNDPLTAGPKLFQTYCITCHQSASWKGEFKEAAVAPELADPRRRTEVSFASREWTKQVLVNYAVHFQSLAATSGPHAEAAANILNGSMKDWSESNGPTLLESENADDLTALVEFIYAQSGRPDALAPDHEQVMKGQQIFVTGDLSAGSIDACVDCHAMRPLVVQEGMKILATESLSEDLYPDLTGYGGVKWISRMISNPEEVYRGGSGDNAMPAFADQLTNQEIELLARWLAQDYFPTQTEQRP